MKVTRSEFAEGFQLLGFVGLLVGVFVVPSQWVSGTIRPEAVVGVLASLACVTAAMILAPSIKPAFVVASLLLLMAGAGYLALVPFVAAEVGWHHWQRIGLLALASAAAAVAGWYGVRRFRQRAQPTVQPEVPASGRSLG